jgi:hypothetical protein
MADTKPKTNTEVDTVSEPRSAASAGALAAGEATFTAESDRALEEQQLAESEGELLDRDAMRAKIFAVKPDTRTLNFFGVRLELRQPPIETMLTARQGNMQNALLMMLVNYAYAPGTDERVFTEEDVDALKGLPLSPDVQRVLQACNELMGVDTGQITQMIQEASKGA